MKRLLLAPLLFLLVSCSSDLTVNRRTVNRRTVNRRTETYLELCNNSELPGKSRDYVYCYKVTGKDREKITTKSFIQGAKELSRERLDACLRPNQFAQSLRPYEQERGCRDFINEPHSYWLMNEITKEQYDLVKKYISEYDLKRIERMERLKYTNIDKELKSTTLIAEVN